MNVLRMVVFSLLSMSILSSCASMHPTPEERASINKGLADYTLCEKLVLEHSASQVLRNEWALELQNRGVNCNQYETTINQIINQRQFKSGVILQTLELAETLELDD